MKEFKVNEYIALKLENGRTNIYINGELFEQCKFLMLNIPVDKMSSLDDIQSIDEAADILGWTADGQEGVKYNIDPETEFWGHCSNLQAWYEYDYNTRLLHSNLSFPLLKKLTEMGDPIANRVFKEEIVKRFESGNSSVMSYLVEGGYLNYLNIEEIAMLFESQNASVMTYLIDEGYLKHLGKEEISSIFEDFDFTKITRLGFKDAFPLLRSLTELGAPMAIKVLKEEITKCFESGNLSVINYLVEEGYLKYLGKEELSSIFKGFEIETLTNLKFTKVDKIEISANMVFTAENDEVTGIGLNRWGLSTLPESITNLKSLELLDLSSNKLSTLPESIGDLTSLKALYLGHNRLTTLPESIGALKSLNELKLGSNKLTTLSDSIKILEKRGVEIYK